MSANFKIGDVCPHFNSFQVVWHCGDVCPDFDFPQPRNGMAAASFRSRISYYFRDLHFFTIHDSRFTIHEHEHDYELHMNLRFTTNDENGVGGYAGVARGRRHGARIRAGTPRGGVVSPRVLFIAALPTAHAVGYLMPPLPGLRGRRENGVNRAGDRLIAGASWSMRKWRE